MRLNQDPALSAAFFFLFQEPVKSPFIVKNDQANTLWENYHKQKPTEVHISGLLWIRHPNLPLQRRSRHFLGEGRVRYWFQAVHFTSQLFSLLILNASEVIVSQTDHSSETVSRGALTFTNEWKLEQLMFNTVIWTGVTNLYLASTSIVI